MIDVRAYKIVLAEVARIRRALAKPSRTLAGYWTPERRQANAYATYTDNLFAGRFPLR